MNRQLLKKIAFYATLLLLIVIILTSSTYIWRYLHDAQQQSQRYDDLASIVDNGRRETLPPKDPLPTVDGSAADEEPAEPEMLPGYAELYALNSDIVGWLEIPDTPVNYPVMQTPTSPEYYLYRNFDREHNAHGCLFAREDCDIKTPSDNITIYGHHMLDGSMFACLSKYTKKSYWETHSTLSFDTLTERHTYTVFAVFKTTASIGEGFPYHRFVNAKDEADFDDFVATCKKLAFYDTGITPAYGDKLICLSTCEYTLTNGRLVVVAVRTDE